METDMDAIYVAIRMFWRKVFTGVLYMSTLPDISFTQKFQDGGRIPEVVNFATENDTNLPR